MRIVLVSEFYYPHPGGVTEHVHHLARHLVRSGHRVRVVTSHVDGAPPRPAHEAVAGYEVVRLGCGVAVAANGSQSRVTVGFGLEQRMQEALAGAELCHVHSPLFPMLPYLALKVARRRGVPTVGTFHTHFGGSRALDAFGAVVRKYAGALDRAIAVSPSAARSVERYLDGPCTVIPNGVDAAAWVAAPPRPELARTRNIVFLGRLDPRNDLSVLLAAFARVACAREDARLVIVGDGPERAALQAEAARLGGRVWFVGAQNSVAARAAFVTSAHVMAFTARIVSHPMALVEGLAAGRPAVAYDIEGVRELVRDGREGYRVPVGDVRALAAALGRVLDDDGHRGVMSRLARARALQFDWRIVGRRIEDEYRSCGRRAALRSAA